MSLEGLRAWIGEVERKLGKRTRVFLALSTIAIAIAGAAVYLAIDARNSSVGESDVQALQERLETRIEELGATAVTPPAETEVEPLPTPEPEPEADRRPLPEPKPPSLQEPEPETGTGGGEGAGR